MICVDRSGNDHYDDQRLWTDHRGGNSPGRFRWRYPHSKRASWRTEDTDVSFAAVKTWVLMFRRKVHHGGLGEEGDSVPRLGGKAGGAEEDPGPCWFTQTSGHLMKLNSFWLVWKRARRGCSQLWPGTIAGRGSRGEETASCSPSAPSVPRLEPGKSGSGTERGSCRPPASPSMAWSRLFVGSKSFAKNNFLWQQ